MKLLSPNRDGAILLAFFIGLGLCAKLPESIAETTPVQGSTQADKAEDKKVTAHIFQIKNLKLEEAKEKIKGLLSKDSQVGASVEELTFMRSGEELKFLVVTDTPLKIQENS